MAINWIMDGEASESGKQMGYSDYRHYKTKSREYRIHAHGNNKWHLTIKMFISTPCGDTYIIGKG